MSVEEIGQVRSFARTVTRRIGVLDEAYLTRDRPLGPSRVLWEIGPQGADVRALRARLGLDSGYLSRVLRTLADDGLVTVGPNDADRRVRTVGLTAAGLAERAELDRRSDDWAGSVLDRLGPGRAARLVAAMTEVELLLTAAMIEIAPADPRSPAARACLSAYFAELDRRFEGGFDPANSSTGEAELTPPAGILLVATLDGDPVGCGGLVFHSSDHRIDPAVIKRMWVSPAVRGTGLGRRLLAALEEQARLGGADVVQLDTHRSLGEAIAMYTSSGYRPTGQVTDEVYAQLWFEKSLGVSRP